MTSAPLNDRISRLAPPPIPAIQASAEWYDGRNGPLIDLSQAVPGYPAHPDLLAWLGEAAGSPCMLGYGPIEGEPVLRAAYAEHLGDLYGASFSPAETHITSGCNQAFVATALTVADSGEAVLLVAPFYFNHDTTLAMLGIRTAICAARPENGFLPDPAEVAAAITPDIKAVAIVTPNNPTGAIYPPSLMEALLELCVEKGIWLIVDETYRDFLPAGASRPHELFAKPGWRNHLIGLYSFSKSFCIPGHRLGAVTAGEQVIAQIAKVMDNLQICAPRPPQAALARGLRRLDSWRQENRTEIAARAVALRRAFDSLTDWEIAALGAYFAYVRHPFEQTAADEVANSLARDKGIVTLPGSYFGEGQDRFLRIAFANARSGEIASLSQRL